jgi:Tfp pilus assembly protein PilV
MHLKKLTRISRDDRGIALVEALVSAMVLIIVSLGVFTAFSASSRATAQERHRARANDLAQQDLERIRSLPYGCPMTDRNCTYSIVSLITPQSKPVTLDGTTYTVTSRAQFLTETPTTSACVTGPDSRDYLQISSTITWPNMGGRPAVTAVSATSPPSGSVVPNTGSLLVTVTDSRGAGIPGVALSGSGPATFNGTTGTSGCVQWRNLPVNSDGTAATYTMSISGVAASKVDKNGNPPNLPQPKQVSVVPQGTTTEPLMFDTPGSLSVNFKTLSYGNGGLTNSSADSVAVHHSVMDLDKWYSVPARAFTIGTPTSPAVLFPFPSPYSVYAGTCLANNPDPQSQGSLAVASPIVPIGGAAPTKTVQLPALHLTVKDGTSAVPGSAVPNATVTVKDLDTGCGSVMRTMTTNSSGQLADPGLPYGTYEVCASALYGTPTQVQRKNYVRAGTGVPPPKEAVPVTDPSAGAVRTIYLGTLAAGVTTGSTQVCP